MTSKAPIRDLSKMCEVQTKFKDRHKLAPKWPFKMIVCGYSGSGKTNLVLNLILYYLHFNKLYVYAKKLDEPIYEYLQNLFNKMKEFIPDDTDNDLGDFRSSLEDVESLDNLDESKQNLVIFDDFLNERDQHIIKDYFTKGRKHNCSTIYISQSYYGTPDSVRQNSDYIALFNTRNKRALSEFKKEFPLSISNDEFTRIYTNATKNNHNFLFIDLKTNDDKLKYRINLDNIEV